MNLSDIPFTISFHIDDDLRDVPDDADSMIQAIAFLEDRLSRERSDAEQRSLLGWIGVFARMTGDLDRAEAALQRALAMAVEAGNRPAIIQSQIRLAHVFQWQQRFDDADSLFVSVIERCLSDEDLQRYLDFALQHYGKSLFDQRRYAEAAGTFQKVLDLRLAGGVEDLIASTRQALDATHAHLPR
jgi:tetratricopeptide (TPR) repeat protein